MKLFLVLSCAALCSGCLEPNNARDCAGLAALHDAVVTGQNQTKLPWNPGADICTYTGNFDFMLFSSQKHTSHPVSLVQNIKSKS